MFRASSHLLSCRITFFTRTPCSLCDTAKAVISNVKSQRPFAYHEINVMASGQEKWKAVYEFDTPVIHVERGGDEGKETTLEALKLMHRFKEEDVVRLMDKAERE